MSHINAKLKCHIFNYNSLSLIKIKIDKGGDKMEKRYIITEVDMKRYDVLKEVVSGRMSLRKAQEIIGISYRQTIRLKKRFLNNGFEGLLRKYPDTPPNLKVTSEIRDEIIRLRKTLYWDFNILHFKEVLKERHQIYLSYESIRKILMENGIHLPDKRKKVYRRRRRMPKAGMLVQMDSSQHRWLSSVKEPWWIIAMVDDADGFCYAEFHPKDTLFANMSVIRTYLEKKGLFMALYTDKASHFKTTRHGGLHYHVEVEQKETHIERALGELGINLINANSPQAKGRIERRFRFFQDWCNKRYTHEVESLYKPLPKDKDLNLIFSIRHPRKVNKDNTVSFDGKVYQLLPSFGVRTFAGKWVEVSKQKDGNIEILYENKRLPYLKAYDKGVSNIKQEDKELLQLRMYIKTLIKETTKKKRKTSPPPDHPWRIGWIKNVTFKNSNKV